MKIKGSVEFENVEQIKENLRNIIKQNGKCKTVKCENCIFSDYYAIKGDCTTSTTFKNSSVTNERLIRAKEILAEIKELEK